MSIIPSAAKDVGEMKFSFITGGNKTRTMEMVWQFLIKNEHTFTI